MLEFDESKHEYRLRGKILPSVTQIIKLISPKFEGIPEAVLEYASQRGRAVHKACEIFNNGQEFSEPLDDVIVPYLDAWKRFIDEKHVRIISSEQHMYHPTMHYAGRFDCIGLIDDEEWTLDIKAIAKLHAAIGVQLAGYNGLRNAHAGKIHCNTHCDFPRAAVQLKPDGTYKFEQYNNRSDFAVFVSCMTVHNFIGATK